METDIGLFGGEIREAGPDDPNRLVLLPHFAVRGEDAQEQADGGHHEFPPVEAKGIVQGVSWLVCQL